MHGVGILYTILIGLLAGWIGSLIVNRHHGLVVNLIIGLIGGVVGGVLADVFGFAYMGFWASLIAATLGAVVLLFLLSLFRRPAR